MTEAGEQSRAHSIHRNIGRVRAAHLLFGVHDGQFPYERLDITSAERPSLVCSLPFVITNSWHCPTSKDFFFASLAARVNYQACRSGRPAGRPPLASVARAARATQAATPKSSRLCMISYSRSAGSLPNAPLLNGGELCPFVFSLFRFLLIFKSKQKLIYQLPVSHARLASLAGARRGN